MFALIWWVLVLAAGFQAGRAWGGATAIGTVVGLFVGSWVIGLVPLIGWLGGWVTAAGAIAIGTNAERTQRQITSR